MNQFKNVLLVNLPYGKKYSYHNAGAAFPATGIMLVGTIFKNENIPLKVIDGALCQDYIQRVLDSIDKNTIMVGFSVMTSQVPMAIHLSRLIKQKNNNIMIVWGGVHPIIFSDQTVLNSNVDIVVTGEGVETAKGLSEYIKGHIRIESINGIKYKFRNDKTIKSTAACQNDVINELPQFDFTILDSIDPYLKARSVYQREIITDKNEKLRLVPILTGLGCCYKCSFCINVILNRRYRFRKASLIIEDIKFLQEKYNINAFLFLDEDFFISKKRLHEFLDLIEENNMHFYWRIWGRVDYFKDTYINKNLIKRMEKCGLRSIAMGAECGSQKVLDMINKGIKVENTIKTAKLLNNTKINPRYGFMIALEGEKESDMRETYRVIAKLMSLNPNVDITGPFFFRYYPGSPIFKSVADKYNVQLPKSLEEWDAVLHEEGFIEIKNMNLMSERCYRNIVVNNQYISIYSRFYRKNNLFVKLIKKFIIYKLKKFDNVNSFDIRIYLFLRNLYRRLKYN